RTYLNLPSEIVPATLKKQAKPAGARPFGGDRPRYPSMLFVFLRFFC
ncbi:40S ribosomal protein s10-like, partial [Trifolium pratense]